VQLKISKLLLYVSVIFVAEFSSYNRFWWQGISAILAILSEQMGKNAKITFWDFVKVCFSFCYGALSIYDDTIEHNGIKSVRILKELHDFDFEIKIALKLTYKNEPKCIKEKLWTI